ncbi:hypothetical protein L1D59_04460 [Pseudoalteromonas piscicida]|uniref:hypothetical protein n=1 Tax=Pseudoalteromonas piscicida TaxID=43662 RepID=UPI001EFEE88D|nr:hypothetical protein [Pseudoalteromonas piscicida]MCG9767848.1 hypothetical protein [Pseudoalteromonas piscicida]
MVFVVMFSFFVFLGAFFKYKANAKTKIRRPQVEEKPHKFVSRKGMTKAKYSGKLFSSNVKGTSQSSSIEDNFILKALEARDKARLAMKSKAYNTAWLEFSRQAEFYAYFANQRGFSPQNALSLVASVDEDFANILRIEKKHKDAFFHILYWVIASSHRPIKKHEQKLLAYFNRCKFEETTLEDVRYFVEIQSSVMVNPLTVKEQVRKWV